MINIDDLIGVKYKNNGRTIKEGMDCYGLAIEVCKRFGYELPDLKEIKHKSRDLVDCENKVLSKVKAEVVKEPEKEADVIFFKNTNGVQDHIGIYLGNGRFIHCNKFGVHIEKVFYYKHMIGRVFRWL